MGTLQPGLYEQLITQELEEQLQNLQDADAARQSALAPAEAADRIALYFGTLLRRAIDGVTPGDRTSAGLNMIRRFITLIAEDSKAVDQGDLPTTAGEMLRYIARIQPDGTPEEIEFPATPLLDTSLLTNAPGEPRIGYQIKSEIPSADSIDVLMAFVRRSGIRPLMEAMRHHIESGRKVRILTTTYTQSTELAALDDLHRIGADIRVSYDTTSTRLHAKAWLFHRHSGYSTAYIGSSNLTHSAQVSGLEWNVRLSAARNPDVIDKFTAVFDSYWENDDFQPFDHDEFLQLTKTKPGGPAIYLSPVEIRPEPFQSRLLEQIALARIRGRHRNLLVSATGTGKTVMAALDYQRLRKTLPRARLLFVAHRKEILEQSLATFRHALRDAAFGELWVGGQKPDRFEHVFASIQSLSAAGLEHLAPDHFDVVIIDEFHHAAARTYRALLEHLSPRELLGLTATPERGDSQPILPWFDGRIAAELRLWDAIEQQRLAPFAYFGISDGTDLTKLSWKRGRGYDVRELDQLVTGDTALAHLIINKVVQIVPNPDKMRALGFCVSVGHAKFMAEQFNRAHLPAIAVWADTPAEERRQALKQLQSGTLRVVFSVDLFNEGVDIPAVDTLLLLRPTDSATVYLQQLGRGLRREQGKTACTVLDFVGQQRREFQFLHRFRALLGGSRKHIATQVEQGFPYLPSGCHMEFDAVASKHVLENIRRSLPWTWPAKAKELRQVAESTPNITLERFLDESGLDLEDIYSSNHSWSDLLETSGLPIQPSGPHEEVFRRAVGRLLHVDDMVRIGQYRAWVQEPAAPAIGTESLDKRRLFLMLVAVLMESINIESNTLDEAAALLWKHPQVLVELEQLLVVLEQRIDHIQPKLSTHPEVPLCIHARYTRREMLAAFSDAEIVKLQEWREGVRWLPDAKVNLLVLTLDKSTGHFSPTTRYKDYAISPQLLHWESQSSLRAASPTGRRYQQFKDPNDSFALPFIRLTSSDRAFWLLGPATYISHQGERPMAITWHLNHAIPGDLFSQFAAAVA